MGLLLQLEEPRSTMVRERIMRGSEPLELNWQNFLQIALISSDE